MQKKETTKIAEGINLEMPDKVPSERNLNQDGSGSGMREHSAAAMQASSTLGSSFNFHTRPVPDNEYTKK